MDFFRERPTLQKVRPADGDFDRRRRAETHHVIDDVRWLKRDTQLGKFCRYALSQSLLQVLDFDSTLLVEIDIENRLFGSARPLVNGVHGKIRGNHTHIAKRERDILSADL